MHTKYTNAVGAKGTGMAMPSKCTPDSPQTKPAQIAAAVGAESVRGRRPCPWRQLKEGIRHAGPSPRRRRNRSFRRIVALGCLGLLVSTSGGCTLFTGAVQLLTRHDACDEFMIGYRNSALAAKAWHREKVHFRNHPFLDNVRDGFIAGYIDVAEGGSGCVPAVCPPEYWGWRYQSADGQRACNAWFEGFPIGAKAAEEDGVGHWSYIRPAGVANPSDAKTAEAKKAAGAAAKAPPPLESTVEGEQIVPGSVIEVDRVREPNGENSPEDGTPPLDSDELLPPSGESADDDSPGFSFRFE